MQRKGRNRFLLFVIMSTFFVIRTKDKEREREREREKRNYRLPIYQCNEVDDELAEPIEIRNTRQT